MCGCNMLQLEQAAAEGREAMSSSSRPDPYQGDSHVQMIRASVLCGSNGTADFATSRTAAASGNSSYRVFDLGIASEARPLEMPRAPRNLEAGATATATATASHVTTQVEWP